jgi:hypothetical protein
MTWIETELNQLSLDEYTFLLIVMMALCIGLLYFSYTSYQKFRYIHGTATSKIRSASQGYVELKGLGEWMPGDEMHSPFSQKRCIWYHCTIERKENTAKRSSWINILDQTSDHIFHLVDETGSCVIDPDGAHVIPASSQTWYGSSPRNRFTPTEKQTPLLGQIGFGDYRFKEQLIEPATPIYVLGLFKTIQKNITTEAVTKRTETLIKHWKIQPDRYLSQYDTDKNGVIQKHEWQLIRLAAKKQILAKIDKDNQPIHLLSRTTQKGKPFILSADDEEHLVFIKKLTAYLSIITALLLFAGILICINIRNILL